MILLLLLFGALGALTPALTRLLSTRVFYVVALLPAAAFVYTLTQTGEVLADRPPTESISWIPQLDIAFSFRVDTLQWVMALIVTGVGALVLVYSARYFSRDEPSLGRIAALLLLFAGTMYGLVTADDVYVLFMFWEITSILSYLLIGHYTNRRESRGAALQALLVTTFGGLAMLVGLVLLQVETGTSSISAIIASHPEGALTTTAVMLVLAGAVSKSALVPFHFWLPAAMAAPTPVSAYLHAAAMVKAGVYLVLLLVPGFDDTPGWLPVLVLLGSLTMLLGAWRSMRQNDLKLLLAYGTVSQLGFLIAVSGFGSRDASLAALTLVIAHALFKSTLFLVVGIIDHDEGTRDLRELSGLGRRRPVLAAIGVIAALSMAGIPPLVGFVAKEAAFTAFIEAGIHGDPWGWVAIATTALGSVFTVAYTARFLWGAFARKPEVEARHREAGHDDARHDEAHEPDALSHGDAANAATAGAHPHTPSRGILVAPAILALASIAGGLLAAPLLDAALATYADDNGEGDYHLALWHGLEAALFVSAAVILLGVLLFVFRERVRDVQRMLHVPLEAGRVYWHVLSTIDHTAARVTMFAQKGGLAQYLGTILVVFVLALGTITAVSRQWPDTFVWFDYPAQVFVAAVMAIAAIMAARAQHRLAAVLLVGTTGYGLVVLFALHGAPDLALTQALVETVTIVVFVLVLRRLPRRIAQHNKPKHKKRRAAIGIAFGATIAVVGWVALGAREAGGLGPELARLALLEGHGENVVNVMLVDIRAWDTMNELSVLVVVATGVASLLFVSGRHELVPRLRESRERRRASNRTRLVDDPHTPTVPAENERQHTWLLGGRTLAPRDRSLVLEVIVRLVFHPAILVSIYLLFVGHNAPGGGFAAGMVAGLALIVRYLAGGRYELGEAVPIGPGVLLGAGILLATGTAVGSLLLGADALTSAYWSADVPVLGYLSFGTSTIFDIGVYLVVIGVVLDVLRSLGGEVDRQLAEDDDAPGDPDGHTISDEHAEPATVSGGDAR